MSSHSPATRPLRADARRNYDALLSAADRAFRARGVQCSLDDIARDAGVGVGTMYRHFPQRDDLIAATLLSAHEALEREATNLLDENHQAGSLARWVRSLAEHFAVYRDLPDSIQNAMNDGHSSLSTSCRRLATLTTEISEANASSMPAAVESDDIFLVAQAIAWAIQPHGCAAGDLDRAFRLFARDL